MNQAGEAIVSNRIEEYAAQFEAVNDETIAFVKECTDEQWRQPTASEGWPVGVVAHHAAEVNQAFTRIIEKIAGGETYSPTISTEEIDRNNAKHASDHVNVSKREVLALLHSNGSALARAIRSLREEQLEQTAGTFGDIELTVTQVIEWVIIGHPAEHLASIRATLGSPVVSH
jgi:hypothetical protein